MATEGADMNPYPKTLAPAPRDDPVYHGGEKADTTDATNDLGLMSGMKSEYVQGKTKKTITGASALNELRSSLEAVNARVHGKKPNDSYEPRTRSRAGKEVPADLSAELSDGTRIDVVQLVQELALVVKDIAQAPSATEDSKKRSAKKTTGGGYPGDDTDIQAVDPSMMPAEDQPRPVATFGGVGVADGPQLADISTTQGSIENAPESPPAMIGPGREAYYNATFGGTMNEVSASPLGQLHTGITQPEYPPPMRILGPVGEPHMSSLGRAVNGQTGGVSPIAAPSRDAYAVTREQMRGGVAPIAMTGLQSPVAQAEHVIGNVEPDNGYVKVIHVPEP